MVGIDPRFYAPAQDAQYNPNLASPDIGLQRDLTTAMLQRNAQAQQASQFQQSHELAQQEEKDRVDQAEAEMNLRQAEFDQRKSSERVRQGREAAQIGYERSQKQSDEDEADMAAMYAAGAAGDTDKQRYIADKLRSRGFDVKAPDVRSPQVPTPAAAAPTASGAPSKEDVARSDQMLSEGDSFNQPGSDAAPSAAPVEPHESVKQDIKKASAADAKVSADLDKGAGNTLRALRGPATVMPKLVEPGDQGPAPALEPAQAAPQQTPTPAPVPSAASLSGQLDQADAAYSKGLGVAPGLLGGSGVPSLVVKDTDVPQVTRQPVTPLRPEDALQENPYRLGTLPGMNPIARAPFGMVPGQRHELTEANPPPAVAPAPEAPQVDNAFRIYDKSGRLIRSIPVSPGAGLDHQRAEVAKMGQALMTDADSPELKAIAQRAMDWGMSQVGTKPVADISKDIVHRYDEDSGGQLRMRIQQMKSARNRGRSGAGAAPTGPHAPTKAEVFENKLQEQGSDLLNKVIIPQEQNKDDYKKLNDLQSETSRMRALMDSDNPMAQRNAVQQLLLTMTGKVSRESEQRSITQSAGIFDRLQNEFSQWTNNPELTPHYVATFKGLLKQYDDSLGVAKSDFAKDAASRAYEATPGAETDKQGAWDYVYGVLSGHHLHTPQHEPGQPWQSGGAPAAKSGSAVTKAKELGL